MNNELIYRYALVRLKGVGWVIAKLLLEHFGSIESLMNTSTEELEKVPGIGKTLLNQITDKKYISKLYNSARQEIEQYQRAGINVLMQGDEHFPALLEHCHDAPFLIYQLGEFSNDNKSIAVVGSRKNSIYGKFATEEVVKELSGNPANIVSGLALGIDTIAHESALENDLPTVAVLAHGLDVIYPQRNRKLAKELLKRGGCLLSEFPFGTKPDRENFPKRNRIVAGMSEATIVTEASEKGGALITANIAHSYGREVFAVPGRINDKQSAGCNRLIAHQKAMMLSHPSYLTEELGFTRKTQDTTQQRIPLDLTDEERAIVNCLETLEVVSKQALALRLKMDISKVGSLLFNLELSGLVASLPGNRFQLLGVMNSR